MLVGLILTSVLCASAVFALQQCASSNPPLQQYPNIRESSGDCSLPADNDTLLGEYDKFSATGLLPSLFITGDGTAAPSLRIIRSRVTCVNTGTRRNTASSVGILVEYERENMPGTRELAQVTVDCISDTHNAMSNFSFYPTPAPGATGSALNTADTRSGSTLNKNVNVNAAFSTELRVDCGECSTISSSRQDPASTCVGCLPECNDGSRRCLGFIAVEANQCCSYFLDDHCVQCCPEPLIPNDVTFDCGCGTLSLINGMVSYSAEQRVRSVATYSCNANDGYALPPEATTTRTCTMNGWTGTDPTCQLHDCKETTLSNPQNGDYVLETGTTTFGSRVTFKCFESYELVGETTIRNCTLNGWSGSTPKCEKKVLMCPDCNSGTCDETTGMCVCPSDKTGDTCLDNTDTDQSVGSGCSTPCIIGIVLAVVGAVILVAIVAGVAYGIFSYLNHPDTKMAKFDNENFNGVARDNPLYVDPEAVVGDGAEAA